MAEAVFQDRVATLCGEADQLMLASSPADALHAWLRALIATSAAIEGVQPG
jgi:hypothetical protein